MPHGIEQFEDGSAAFFSNRVPAWHRLGQITEGALTADDALKIAQLDWDVIKSDEPVLAKIGDKTMPIEGRFATYRQHPKKGLTILGIVGNQYEVVQNAEAFRFLSLLTDEHGAVFETAGSLHEGKNVFVTMKMPKDIQVGGQDLINSYIVCTTAHDGSGAFQVVVTPTRVVCQNTLTMALGRNAQARLRWKHTRNVTANVQHARETLGVTFSYMDEFEKAANKLISQTMTDKQFNNFVDKLVMPRNKESKRAVTNMENTKETLQMLWKAPTQENISNTRWAAYNAVTEYRDWIKPVRGSGEKADLRAMRVLSGKSDAISVKAMALLNA
jgi:phage/plasmid-like protein (TIGR03299 family)